MKKIRPFSDPDADPILPRATRRAAKLRKLGGQASSLEQALRADPRVSLWLVDPLDPKAAQTLTRLQSLPGLQRLAVMPDVHPSADVCVGSVLGTAGVVYPQAIGGDIGCGMSAVALDSADLPDAADRRAILDALSKSIDIIVRKPTRTPATPPRFAAPDAGDLSAPTLRKLAAGEGELQLGTLGRGNHFVELQHDEAGRLWLMVHSGSRFMGQAVARRFTQTARAEGVRSALLGLPVDHPAGPEYLRDQAWCTAYARANRQLLLAAAAGAVAKAVGPRADWATYADAPHNFIREETHDGLTLLVHRKGAAPAPAGAVGLIPGSAGTLSVHVEGRGDPRSMASSSHGAGRLYSRSDAKTLVTERDLREQMGKVIYDDARARTLRDEAPAVYRDLRLVMEAQRDLVKVTRTLTPLVSFKAGG